jgi:hypothetical protein
MHQHTSYMHIMRVGCAYSVWIRSPGWESWGLGYTPVASPRDSPGARDFWEWGPWDSVLASPGESWRTGLGFFSSHSAQPCTGTSH